LGSSSGDTLTKSLGATPQLLGRLVATESTTPDPPKFFSFVVAIDKGIRNHVQNTDCRGNLQVGLGGGDNGSKFLLVLALDILESEDGSSLLVDDGAETGFGLDDDVWDTHLAAQGRDKNDELNGVNVMSNDDEVGLLGLDQSNTVVKTILDEEGFLILQPQLGIATCGNIVEPTFFSSALPSATALAPASSRAFFSCLVSGRYLLRSLKSSVAVFLSRVWEN